jgi:methionine synthase II (cobalamin-independent)
MITACIGMGGVDYNDSISPILRDISSSEINESQAELKIEKILEKLHTTSWKIQAENNIDQIAVSGSSFCNTKMQHSCFIGDIPLKYYLSSDVVPNSIILDMYRGKQVDKFDVVGCPLVRFPEDNSIFIEHNFLDGNELTCSSNKSILSALSAKKICSNKLRVIQFGPVSYTLSGARESDDDLQEVILDQVLIFNEFCANLRRIGVYDIQFDELCITWDVKSDYVKIYNQFYNELSRQNKNMNIHIVPYYGSIKLGIDSYLKLNVTSLHFPMVSSADINYFINNIDKISSSEKLISLGIVDATNFGINDFNKSIELLKKITQKIPHEKIIITTSNPLTNCPLDLDIENCTEFPERLSFSKQKIKELNLIKERFLDCNLHEASLQKNKKITENIHKEWGSCTEIINKIKSDYLKKENNYDKFFAKNQIENDAQDKMLLFALDDHVIDLKKQHSIGFDILSHSPYGDMENLFSFLSKNFPDCFYLANSSINVFLSESYRPLIIKKLVDIKIFTTKIKELFTSPDLSFLKDAKLKRAIKFSIPGPFALSHHSSCLDLNYLDHKDDLIIYFSALVKIMIDYAISQFNEKVIIQLDEPTLCTRYVSLLGISDYGQKFISSVNNYIFNDAFCSDKMIKNYLFVDICDFDDIEFLFTLPFSGVNVSASRNWEIIFNLFSSYRHNKDILIGICDPRSDRVVNQNDVVKIVNKAKRFIDTKHIHFTFDSNLKYFRSSNILNKNVSATRKIVSFISEKLSD